MKPKIIEVKLGTERHRLEKDVEGKRGCIDCSLNGVCRNLGSTSYMPLCKAMIHMTYECPTYEFPYEAHFEEK